MELVDEGGTHDAAVGDWDETDAGGARGEESMEKRRGVRDGRGGDDGRRGERSVEDEFDRERAQGGGEEQGVS